VYKKNLKKLWEKKFLGKKRFWGKKDFFLIKKANSGGFNRR
jgi:hypothetical protein